MTLAGDGEPPERAASPEIALEARLVRQGRRSLRILWVMTVSLALAVLALFGLFAAELAGAHRTSRVAAADARPVNGGVPTARSAMAQTPGAGPTR